MKKRLFILGDTHFSNERDWDLESFEKFIDWFSKYDFGNKEDCELLQLGDLTEKSKSAGKTYGLLLKFMTVCLTKFSKIYILGGNHCMKYNSLRNEVEYSSEFLGELDDSIKLIYDETEFTALDGKLSVLALPFKYTTTSIENYYNNNLKPELYTNHYNLICGHVTIFDEKFKIVDGINLKKFNFDHAVFGHIHNRCGTNAKYYPGSIMPFRKSEEKTELPRCIKVIDEDNNELDEIQLPIFRQYHTINFQTEKPKYKRNSTDIVHVYELTNCDEKTIINFCSEYYIKKSITQNVLNIENIVNNSGDDDKINNENVKNLLLEDDFVILEKMCKDNDIILKRKTKALLRELLTNKK